jgi:hypothetical protein
MSRSQLNPSLAKVFTVTWDRATLSLARNRGFDLGVRPLSTRGCTVTAAVLLLAASISVAAAPNDFFRIQVVDGSTGRGVPLVELRTVNKASWWTDSNGIIAFDEPGLMDLEVFFHVQSPGYEMPTDLLGNRGVKLKPAWGSHAEIRLKRVNIAERLYRITGQGIYRDSLLVGRPAPLKHPVINGQVMGQDTVIATPTGGKSTGSGAIPIEPPIRLEISALRARLPSWQGAADSIRV